jgi:amidohydrolase
MVREGVLAAPACRSIFGLHVWPGPGGHLSYRSGGIMAADDRISIRLTGRQTHGAVPWKGIDLAALVADCVQAINQIAARQIDVTSEPTVITITTINGGNRPNIIPEDFVLTGTLRTFSKARRQDVIERVTKRVTALALSYGAVANVEFVLTAPLTFNDATLSARLLAPLTRAAGGADRLNSNATPITAAEDFAEYQAKIPGVFCFLGATAPGVDPATSAPNHSPFFDVWEPAMEVGVRAHVLAALEMLRR